MYKIKVVKNTNDISVKKSLMPNFFFEMMYSSRYWYGDWYSNKNHYVYYSNVYFGLNSLSLKLKELDKFRKTNYWS